MYQFTEDCLTGIPVIDEEHRRLFQLINDAFILLEKPETDMETVKTLVIELRSYASTHFKHEEVYMEEHQDPELERQKKEHAVFAAKISTIDLEKLESKTGKEIVEKLLIFLSKWLYRHILGSDIMIGKMTKQETEDIFAFTEKYKTGVELIDAEHQRLFEIIRATNEIIHAEHLHDKYDEIVHVLTELKDYTVLHFHDEEDYMERIHYDGLEAQKRAHEAFVEKLEDISLEEVDAAQEVYLEELINFLLGWLTNHILKVDKLIPVK